MTDPRIYTTATPLKPGSVPGQWTASGRVAGMQPKGSVWREAEAAHGFPAHTYLRADYPTGPEQPEEPEPELRPVLSSHNGIGDVFLQSDILSVGINTAGGLGSKQAAPSGFSTDTANSYTRVGLYADLDGFGTGAAPRMGDVILQASPIEGFGIGYNAGAGRAQRINWGTYAVQHIPGALLDESTSTEGRVRWQGATLEGLKVDQLITLSGDAGHIDVAVTLTNDSAKTFTDLRYMRSIDPDQGRNAFKTDNRIVEQGPGKARVEAHGINADGWHVFLETEHPGARVAIWGFNERDVYAPQAWENAQAEGTKATADKTLRLTFKLPDLAPGASTVFGFRLGVAR